MFTILSRIIRTKPLINSIRCLSSVSLENHIVNPVLNVNQQYYRYFSTNKPVNYDQGKVQKILNRLKELGIDDSGKEKEIENASKRGEISEIYEVSKQ